MSHWRAASLETPNKPPVSESSCSKTAALMRGWAGVWQPELLLQSSGVVRDRAWTCIPATCPSTGPQSAVICLSRLLRSCLCPRRKFSAVCIPRFCLMYALPRCVRSTQSETLQAVKVFVLACRWRLRLACKDFWRGTAPRHSGLTSTLSCSGLKSTVSCSCQLGSNGPGGPRSNT